MRTILDLCSGLGGATRAFVVHPHSWRVIRVDNDPRHASVAHTRVLDVLEWLDWIDDLPTIDVVWASPPCTDFTNADSRPRTVRGDPDMSVLEACIAIKDYLQPRTFIIENVCGACPWFKPYLGNHRQKIGPFFLWGNFPHLVMDRDFKHDKMAQSTFSRSPLRSLIPLEISEALLDALTNQQTLEDFT